MIADNAKIQADSARMKVEAHIACARMQQKDTDIALASDRPVEGRNAQTGP
jgi:hypothetical protein